MNERNKYIANFMKRIAAIKESSGFDALREIRTFRTSFSIYSGNYRVLAKTLKRYYANTKIHSENSVKRWRKQRIVVKDIHNLISSAHSYVEHISEKKSSKSSKNKIPAEFENHPLYHFIRALRNFLIHNEALQLISRKEYSHTENGEVSILQYESMNKESFKSYLETSTKNSHNTYDKLAIQYLQQLPDKINLNTIMEEFHDLICSFHKGFILTYVSENKDDLHNLYSEIMELHKDAESNGLTQGHPITKAQLRHLHLLLKKSDKLYHGGS